MKRGQSNFPIIKSILLIIFNIFGQNFIEACIGGSGGGAGKIITKIFQKI